MKKIVLLFAFFTIFIFGYSEIFSIPIKDSNITSSFGEYRNTGNDPHFHLGVDFSTFNRENIDVYCSSDGYLYKVWINDPVYGNTVFIKHDDLSLITVYGHLNSFSDKIESFIAVVRKQYEKQDNRIEVIFPNKEIPVKRNEIIAKSGSTGEALAPHLHFEVREETGGDELIRDPLEYLEYYETRVKSLELMSVRANNKYYDVSENESVNIEYYGDYPSIEIRVREKLGNNTTIMVKNIKMKINDKLVYETDFSKILGSEAYNPDPVFGYGSTSSIYWVKLYSNVFMTPIKTNNLLQLTGNTQKTLKAEIILEDFWGNKKSYYINFIKY